VKDLKDVIPLTDPLFFDTDCLSSFLSVGEQDLLVQLYPGRINIPLQVHRELSSLAVPVLKAAVDVLLKQKKAEIKEIEFGTSAYKLFSDLTAPSFANCKAIGRGEAACIALARRDGGTIASNNLSDVRGYAKKYKLRIVTTGIIMVEALNKKCITEDQADRIWEQMYCQGFRLGASTFSDYVNSKGFQLNRH